MLYCVGVNFGSEKTHLGDTPAREGKGKQEQENEAVLTPTHATW